MKILRAILNSLNPSRSNSHIECEREKLSLLLDEFSEAYRECSPHTTRANHRNLIFVRSKNPDIKLDDEIENFTDPNDFNAYTTEELEKYTSAIESLYHVFREITQCIDELGGNEKIYKQTEDVFKATSELFRISVEGYSHAAYCSLTNALEDKVKNCEDKWKLMLLEARSKNVDPSNGNHAEDEVDAYKVKINSNTDAVNILKQKAEEAKLRSEELCSFVNTVRFNSKHLS